MTTNESPANQPDLRHTPGVPSVGPAPTLREVVRRMNAIGNHMYPVSDELARGHVQDPENAHPDDDGWIGLTLVVDPDSPKAVVARISRADGGFLVAFNGGAR